MQAVVLKGQNNLRAYLIEELLDLLYKIGLKAVLFDVGEIAREQDPPDLLETLNDVLTGGVRAKPHMVKTFSRCVSSQKLPYGRVQRLCDLSTLSNIFV
jgi:hypothetical protein